MAQKDYGKYGRDYIEREDSPLISPIELIGGIILIVGGYWALRGICSVLDNMGSRLKGEKRGEVSNNIKNSNTPRPCKSLSDFDKTKIHAEIKKDWEKPIIEKIETLEHKLACGLRMSETEIDKLYCHYRAKWDYSKLSELLRTRRTSYIIEDLEQTMLYINVPYSRDWQSQKEWIDENEANASGKVDILCDLACEKILSSKKRIRAMRKIAVCYALGYGKEKDICMALLWADALATYELEINNIK